MPHTHPLQPPFAQNGDTTQHKSWCHTLDSSIAARLELELEPAVVQALGSPSRLGLGKCCIPPCIVFDSRCTQVVVVHKSDQNKMPHTHPLQPLLRQNGDTTQHKSWCHTLDSSIATCLEPAVVRALGSPSGLGLGKC